MGCFRNCIGMVVVLTDVLRYCLEINFKSHLKYYIFPSFSDLPIASFWNLYICSKYVLV